MGVQPVADAPLVQPRQQALAIVQHGPQIARPRRRRNADLAAGFLRVYFLLRQFRANMHSDAAYSTKSTRVASAWARRFCYTSIRVVEVAAGRPQRAIIVHGKEHTMLKLYLSLQSLWADKRGVTAIEYAVLAGAVAVGLAAVAGSGGFDDIGTLISNALPDPATGKNAF
jgi:Flp pilus assembly pilin Flp